MENYGDSALAMFDIDPEYILTLVPGWVYWKNLNSVYLGCNLQMIHALGLKRSDDGLVDLARDSSKKSSESDLVDHQIRPNVRDIRGKTDYGLPWGQDIVAVEKLLTDDQYVIRTGKSIITEDRLIVNAASATTISLRAEKKPLYNRKNQIVGVLGIAVDITEQREAIRLHHENELQRSLLAQEREKFRTNIDKVVHDIRSPLASLLLLSKVCTTITNRERQLLNTASTRISDITNQLLNASRNMELSSGPWTDERETLLVSWILSEVSLENALASTTPTLRIDHQFTEAGVFAWITIQPSGFKSMMALLIQKAVEKLGKTGCCAAALELDADDLDVRIIIRVEQDRASLLLQESIQDLGLSEIQDFMSANHGRWKIDTDNESGSSIHLTFPRVKPLRWIAESIQLTFQDIILILDDDKSIHMAWELKFEKLKKQYPELTVRHFDSGEDLITYMNKLSHQQKRQVFLFADYDLLEHELTGLDIIQKTRPNRSMLVTSHFNNKQICERAARTNTKILPKYLAAQVPIFINQITQGVDHIVPKHVDAIFVDDEQCLLDGFKLFLHDKVIDTYLDPQTFLDNIHQYSRDIPIMLDQNYANSTKRGIQIAEQLHHMGFRRLYLLSGEVFTASELPDYLTIISKTDLDLLSTALNYGHP